MIVGTAGHIDHGKTALVKALTGVDADRLREEKARGITIDLGYAYAPLASGEILGFVDVPGHERFIHNMLAGASGIDFALLVVAADDGVMPQTREHLAILDLLGLRLGAVALTKIDRVDEERAGTVAAEIQNLLAGTSLSASPLFPVSALNGTGIAALRAHLEAVAGAMGRRRLQGGFRLAIDRCFSVTGAGTVVTGTVFSGRVTVGERLLLSPSGLPLRVRGIHAQNRPAESGLAGQRCALNLADLEKQHVRRGDWIVAPALHRPTTRLDVRLTLLPGETRPLRDGSPLQVHLGAFRASARVSLLVGKALEPGASAYAQLLLERPTLAVTGDRCVLRDVSAQRTLGGGTVLDAQPPQRGRRSPDRLAVLAALEQPSPAERLYALLALSPQGLDLQGFAGNANLTAAELDTLCLSPDVHRISGTPIAFAPNHWARLGDSVLMLLQQEHEAVPESPGLNSEQLRLRAAPRLTRAAFLRRLDELRESGALARSGSWWHCPGHAMVLSAAEQVLWTRIAPLLAATPFQPPRVRDIARAEALDETGVRTLLMHVARAGQVHRIAHDHYFARDAVADLAGIARTIAREAEDGAVLAAEFRNRVGTGRKLAIQILEYFDRVGFTRRLRDAHLLRDDSLQF